MLRQFSWMTAKKVRIEAKTKRATFDLPKVEGGIVFSKSK